MVLSNHIVELQRGDCNLKRNRQKGAHRNFLMTSVVSSLDARIQSWFSDNQACPVTIGQKNCLLFLIIENASLATYPDACAAVVSSDSRVVRTSVSGALDSSNHFIIDIHSFAALRLALKGQCGGQTGKFTCCADGKGTWRDSPILLW